MQGLRIFTTFAVLALRATCEKSTVTLWLYAPTAGNDTWSSWYSSILEHRVNVTGVAPCLYLVDSTGAFTSQLPNASALSIARNWTSRFASNLGLAVQPLIAASGTGMNAVIVNGTLSSALVAATIQEATALGLSGYNLQLEEPGSPAIQVAWTAFLQTWLLALQGHNLTLSVIIGGVCRARDWMYMDCGTYRLLAENATLPLPNLRIIAEATYEGEPSLWVKYLGDLIHGLGTDLLQLGMEYKPPLTNPGNGCLPAARAAGVNALYVWVNTPAGTNGTDQAPWNAFGWWLNTSQEAAASTPPPTLTILALGDWGGAGAAPFTTPGEVGVAAGMAIVAARTTPPPSAVLALGDNFYPLGLCNNFTFFNDTYPCLDDAPGAGTMHDPRLHDTFEGVFTAPALQGIPWYPIAGNHDALGNVSAEIAYSSLSGRWKFPANYYVVQFTLPAGGEWRIEVLTRATASVPLATNTSDLVVSIMMLDVTLWWGVFSDPVHDAEGQLQWAWVNQTLPVLANSSDFLLVAGHYPLYSACSHGNVPYMIDNLLPLLGKYRVSAYLSGHDHCGEHLQVPITTPASMTQSDTLGHEPWLLDLAVTGTGDGCCYNESNIDSIAPATLQWLLSAGYNPTNETGGFLSLQVVPTVGTTLPASSFLIMHWHAANGSILHSSNEIPRRNVG